MISKQVAALSAEALEAMVADAEAAFAAATTTADLKAARLAHVGEKSPIALANREIAASRRAQGRRSADGARPGAAQRGVGGAPVKPTSSPPNWRRPWRRSRWT